MRVYEPREQPPVGYQPPEIVYLVEFTDESQDTCLGQAGGFKSEAEAEVVRARLDAEGRHGPMRINMVPIHVRAEDWEYDR